MDTSRVDVSMQCLGKRLEVLRKRNDLNILQNEVSMLESELRQLEMQAEELHIDDGTGEMPERTEERPRRHLPDIPSGRRETVTIREPPLLHLYDESSIVGTGDESSNTAMQSGSAELAFGPVTSTPSAPTPRAPEPTGTTAIKPHDKSGAKIKPATFDGTVHWTDYKAHFDACAELNGWTEKEKGLYLAVSLRGQAQGVFGNLSSKSNDYKELSTALQERFAPSNQTELYRVQLKERRQKATESLTELGQDVWRLTNLAYPTAPADLRETLAKEQFIDALVSSDMRLRIKQARPTSLNMAVRHAVELEAFNKAERKHLEGQGFMRATNQKVTKETNTFYELKTLQDSMLQMQKTLEVSDSCHAGLAKDTSGPNLCQLTETLINNGIVAQSAIVPDEEADIKSKLLDWCDRELLDVIFTTGGTGFAPRDITPEVTKSVIQKEAPGMTIAMIKNSLDVTPKAMLSRLACGIRGSTIIINLPGSKKGSEECFRFVLPAFPHAVDLLKGHKQQVVDTHKALQSEDSLSKTPTESPLTTGPTPAKSIRLVTRTSENSAPKETGKPSSSTVTWSKLVHGQGCLLPTVIHSPEISEGSPDDLGRLVIDEEDETEKSSYQKSSTSKSLTVGELLKRKRKQVTSAGSRKHCQDHETVNLNSEQVPVSHAFQPTSNVGKKAKPNPSPRTKVQTKKNTYQIPKTRAQRKLYVQQIRDLGMQNTEDIRLESESVVNVPNSVEKGSAIEKSGLKGNDDDDNNNDSDDYNNGDNELPQGDTNDDVISFTTDMYSDHDLSARVPPLESTVHEDIICQPDLLAKPVKNSENKSEYLHRLLIQADQELEIIKNIGGDKNVQDKNSVEEPDSQPSDISENSIQEYSEITGSVSEAPTPEDIQKEKNSNSASGSGPKADTNPTTQIRSEMETKTGAQILYELSQRSFTRLVMGNNGNSSVENQSEAQSVNSALNETNVFYEEVIPNANDANYTSDANETKKKRKMKSTKALSHKKHESEVSFAQVGESAKIFVQKHPMLRGIYLNKGKREVKRNLIKLKRHQSAIDMGSYLRNGRVNDKNRIDDMFHYTEEGLKKKVEIDENNARDEYVVNWYMWCPGHGNCLRKCGGYGHCVEGCPGSRHKQDRHNCSLMLNWKLYLSDLEKWQIHITGSHIPIDSDVIWTLPAPIYQRLDEDTRDLILKYKDKKDLASIEQMLIAKNDAPSVGAVPSSVKIRRFMLNKKKYQQTRSKQKPVVESKSTASQSEQTESVAEPVEVFQVPVPDNEGVVVTDSAEEQQVVTNPSATFYQYEAIPISCPPQQSTNVFPTVINDQTVSVPMVHPGPITIHNNETAADIIVNAENVIPSSASQCEQHMPAPQTIMVHPEEQTFTGNLPVMAEILGSQLDPGSQIVGSQPGTIIAGHIPQFIQAEHMPMVPQAVQMVPSDFGDFAVLFAACQQQQQQEQQQQQQQ